METVKVQKKKRKAYFEIMKKMMKCRYKQPKFVFLGEELTNSAVILSNHEGTDAPMALEIYLQNPIRMWGAHEMNSGLKKLYKYQTRVYYHEKKHWNLHLARLFCLIASPLTNLFYSGLDLISTYKDGRFIKTIRESIKALKDGDNIVIFPENSEKGYLEELEGFHAGFVLLCFGVYAHSAREFVSVGHHFNVAYFHYAVGGYVDACCFEVEEYNRLFKVEFHSLNGLVC